MNNCVQLKNIYIPHICEKKIEKEKRADEVFNEHERVQKRLKRLANIDTIKQRESLKRKKYREGSEYVRTEHLLRKKRKFGFSFSDSVTKFRGNMSKCFICVQLLSSNMV